MTYNKTSAATQTPSNHDVRPDADKVINIRALDAKQFIIWKCDLTVAIIADRRLTSTEKIVAIVILGHVNGETMTTKNYTTDQRIMDETGLSERAVQRARLALKRKGWLTWQAGPYGKGNRDYRITGTNLASIRAEQATLREARRAKRQAAEGTPSPVMDDARHPSSMTPSPVTDDAPTLDLTIDRPLKERETRAREPGRPDEGLAAEAVRTGASQLPLPMPPVIVRSTPPSHRAEGKHPIPDDWQPSARAYAVAGECQQSVKDIEGIFRDYIAAHGKQYADFDAAFCKFIRTQRGFERGGGGRNHPPGRGSIIAALDRDIERLERKIAISREAAGGTVIDHDPQADVVVRR